MYTKNSRVYLFVENYKTQQFEARDNDTCDIYLSVHRACVAASNYLAIAK